MSRIDQALARAFRNRTPEVRIDARALDEYPGERPSPSGAQEAPPRLLARSVLRVSQPEDVKRADHIQIASPPGQQYRRLAEVLHARRLERGLKSLTVTCAAQTNETSSAAVTLALALTTLSSQRVLVIDSEGRPPFVHAIAGSGSDVGSTDLLRADHREIHVNRVTDLLHVLPVAHHGSGAWANLAPVSMRTLVEACAEEYDWVLVNAPAVSLLQEPRALALQTDGVVFAVSGSTPFPVVEPALASIGRAHIIGTVLLGIGDEPSPPAPTRDVAARD